MAAEIATSGHVEVQLTRGKVALIDRADAERVLAHKWYAESASDGGLFYARRTFRRPDGGRTNVFLHTFLTGYAITDHIDGDGLNNRRENLRPATLAENNRNRRLGRSSTTGYKGVSLNKKGGFWFASIWTDRRSVWLGRHATPELAARAYDAAARELYGEFARLNFPSEAR